MTNTIYGLFEEIVKKQPDAAAVIENKRTMTFRELSENLTPFMIPEFIVKMPHIPLNSNGKPDMTRMPVVMKEGKAYEAIG